MPASGADRVAMLQRLVEGESRFSVDGRELGRAGPSFTVDTLRELHAEQPGTRWWLVIGQDQYARFDAWHDWRGILALAGLAVAARDGDPVHAAPGLAGVEHARRIVQMPPHPHSATAVRARAAAGLDVTALVGAPVARYIADHHLYRVAPSRAGNLPIRKTQEEYGYPQTATRHCRWPGRRQGPGHPGLQHRAPVAAVRARDRRAGASNRQTKALAASVRDAVKSAGMEVLRTEGEENGEWIIVDSGAAVAHIMQPSIRDYYRLEEIWGGKPVAIKLNTAAGGLVKASEGR